MFAARIVVSVTNAVYESKAHLHPTEPPNALPTSWHWFSRHSHAAADPGQPRGLLEAVSLSNPSSLSVMAATLPAMSAQSVIPATPVATLKLHWQRMAFVGQWQGT